MRSSEGSKEPPRHIPWGYGKTRITGMPVDPERLFAYWEVTDSAAEAARASLGAGSRFILRIHDVTGRIFDGVNSHASFDVPVDRSDRQWFVTVGRPASAAVVEIGLLAPDGGYVPLARSRRVEFPRRDPAPVSVPEWGNVKERVSSEVRRGPVGVELISPSLHAEAAGSPAGAAPVTRAPAPAGRAEGPKSLPAGGAGGSESRLAPGHDRPRGGASEKRLGGGNA